MLIFLLRHSPNSDRFNPLRSTSSLGTDVNFLFRTLQPCLGILVWKFSCFLGIWCNASVLVTSEFPDRFEASLNTTPTDVSYKYMLPPLRGGEALHGEIQVIRVSHFLEVKLDCFSSQSMQLLASPS